ncbi:hypothetical protein [Agrococcus jejuensis]|uniref:Zinc-finger n=1 Tax=Agrococcus jejuensis TaxID=399736 RepID=A0A1G8G2E1_9MICO|nr:hypothetical protein [Agrococcus jejuensis]SDH88532.1 hypothetical protein SAMN04489720_2727 [Agrococcus jejuensis]
MHDDTADRHEALIAAALAGDLTAAEEAELAALDAAHPDLAAERADMEALVARLSGVDAWSDVEPSAELEARIAEIGAAEAAPSVASVASAAPGRATDDAATRPVAASAPVAPPASLDARRRRRRLLLPLAAGAAACLAIGVGIGAAAFGERPVPVVQGPPGTLGAVEDVAFVGAPAGLAITGALVAHTWGTETVLTIDGLPAGEAFTVVVVGEDGTEYESGAMLGSDVTIDCRLNAAVLREDVAAVEIRAASGDEIAHADVVDV